jgi:SPP1 family predicted phage head-tail adaptor
MFFSDSITLRAITAGADTDGYSVPTNTDTVVWANEKSVTRSEFYAANANKIDATTAFEVHVEDWNNQTQVISGAKTYYIIRAYQKGEGIVELTCSDKAV